MKLMKTKPQSESKICEAIIWWEKKGDGKDVYFVLFSYLLFRCLGQLRTLYTYA